MPTFSVTVRCPYCGTFLQQAAEVEQLAEIRIVKLRFPLTAREIYPVASQEKSSNDRMS